MSAITLLLYECYTIYIHYHIAIVVVNYHSKSVKLLTSPKLLKAFGVRKLANQ